MNRAAASTGTLVQASHAGRVASITAELFGGYEVLAAEIGDGRRDLINAFLEDAGPNGPLGGPDSGRLRINNRVLVSFQAFGETLSTETSAPSVRDWIDLRLQTGLLRAGFIFNCNVCPWVEFYRLEDVGQSFLCARCGARNHVTAARWRKPTEGPTLFYEMHPTAIEYFSSNGDVPTLAATKYRTGVPGPHETAFELELIDKRNKKPWCEIDFVVLSPGRLAVGEAKSSGMLDGKNRTQRKNDVDKLFRVAAALAATDVCFASATNWMPSARAAIESAAAAADASLTVSILEMVKDPAKVARTIVS